MKKSTIILNRLSKLYPDVKCSLDFKNKTQMFISVCLSANCSDAMVNKVTPKLFERFKTFEDYAGADVKEIEKYIRSLGLYKNKSRNIKDASEIIVSKHKGRIPKDMDSLMELPGVGRKIANVVQAVGFGIMEGIAVDTHVSRLSQRLEITQNNTPNKIEEDLMKQVPQKRWDDFSLLLIYHGRAICKARNPTCSQCVLNDICPSSLIK